jgi:26S proteasome regulatory subunit (ATPase 3-interacting protein)
MQGVSDMLASQGVKKTQAEKALDALADKGSIVRKEFGKTKIYFPSQEGLAELEPEVNIL